LGYSLELFGKLLAFFRGDKDLAFSSGAGGSADMPGTTAGGIDNFLLSLPFLTFFGSQYARFFMLKIGIMAQFWNGGTRCRQQKNSWIGTNRS